MRVQLKNLCSTERIFFENLMNHVEGIGSRFAELHAKSEVKKLLEFVSQPKDRRKILTLRYKSTVIIEYK